ncbi:MAG: polysaccharide deacetylase family protein [Alphaproteobacteria bacterium]
MRLATHGRYDYHPIAGRPDYTWPDGRRLAVYIGLNLEHFAFGEGLGAELAAGAPAPDVMNFAWRDYGNRVGAWRLRALFAEFGLPVSLLVNSTMYDYAPALLDAYRADGAEFVGHGRSNAERQGGLDEPAERALIAETTGIIARAEGAAPAGWLGPWISESHATPDLLAEAGYRYVLDWCMDDQPVWLRTRAGKLLAVPYPQELNDIPAIVGRRVGAGEFADMIVDNLDEMLEQSAEQPLVMGIALHAYIVGQPYRLRHLRRALRHIVAQRDRLWLTTAGAIAAHAGQLPPGTVPGDRD